MKDLKELSNAELRIYWNKEASFDSEIIKDEIIRRFLAQKEIPVKDLLEKAFNDGFYNDIIPGPKSYTQKEPILKFEDRFDWWLSQNKHMIPVAEKPDLSEFYNDIKNSMVTTRHEGIEKNANIRLLKIQEERYYITLKSIDK
jgi:hypothetical protein